MKEIYRNRYIGDEKIISLVSTNTSDIMLTNLEIRTATTIYKFERCSVNGVYSNEFELLVTRCDRTTGFTINNKSRTTMVGELVYFLNNNLEKINEKVDKTNKIIYEGK